jgi:hypothetical protein
MFLVISKKIRKSVEQGMRVALVPDRTACHAGGWEMLGWPATSVVLFHIAQVSELTRSDLFPPTHVQFC